MLAVASRRRPTGVVTRAMAALFTQPFAIPRRPALAAALFMLAVFLEGQFITPTIIGRRLEINNLAVIPSLLFWSWMWGPMGAFLASPLLIVGLIVKEHLPSEGSS